MLSSNPVIPPQLIYLQLSNVPSQKYRVKLAITPKSHEANPHHGMKTPTSRYISSIKFATSSPARTVVSLDQNCKSFEKNLQALL